MKEYDVVIIGGGPAGLTAGLYTSRARLKSLLIERGAPGGEIVNAELVENFPGFPEGISGMDLSMRLAEQANKYGLENLSADVTAMSLRGQQKVITTSDGEVAARAVIIATGSERSKLGVPGEGEFTGRGVSYCATCDAAFFASKRVAVVGGGNAAVSEALHLSKFASHVTLIHRRHELRATPILQERILAEPKVSFFWDSTVEEISGAETVKKLKLLNVNTKKTSFLEVDGVFVSVGFKPNSEFVRGFLAIDETTAQIVTDKKLETKVPGIFAAGDVRTNSGRQAITAAGDGALAGMNAGKYLGH